MGREEAERCYQANAWLAATILYGSILETILLAVIDQNKQIAMQATHAPRIKGDILPTNKWKLESILNVVHELGWIDSSLAKYSHALRDSRNLIHPSKQINERSTPDDGIAKISRLVVESVIASITNKKTISE